MSDVPRGGRLILAGLLPLLACAAGGSQGSAPRCASDAGSPGGAELSPSQQWTGLHFSRADGTLVLLLSLASITCPPSTATRDTAVVIEIPPSGRCVGSHEIGRHPLHPAGILAGVGYGYSCSLDDPAGDGTLELTRVDRSPEGEVDGAFGFDSGDEAVSGRFHSEACPTLDPSSIPRCP